MTSTDRVREWMVYYDLYRQSEVNIMTSTEWGVHYDLYRQSEGYIMTSTDRLGGIL